MKKMTSVLFAAIAVAVMVGSAGAGIVIDFESDSDGPQANGFSSVDSALVTFEDSMGADLDILEGGYPGYEGDGQSLAVPFDDDSFLIMNFTSLVQDISVDFGNDDPGFATAGDVIVLTLFLSDVQVGQTEVVVNLDDLMNQSIGINDVVFDKATIKYEVSGGLTEVVDNISFVEVPEPATLLLLGLGGVLLRKRRA